jgi:hypothetical protein
LVPLIFVVGVLIAMMRLAFEVDRVLERVGLELGLGLDFIFNLEHILITIQHMITFRHQSDSIKETGGNGDSECCEHEKCDNHHGPWKGSRSCFLRRMVSLIHLFS